MQHPTTDGSPPAPATDNAPATVIRLEGIKKRYGDQFVLRGIDLTIGAGELVSLVGRSGSGKSTLLHIAGGLDCNYEGRAWVMGVDLKALSDAELARFRNERVGFVFQSFHLLEHLSAIENVMLPHWFAKDAKAGREPAERAREALSRVGIAEHAEKRPGALSGGQKQRVAIARALYHRPSLLLADEPTGNLDSETGHRIIELFQELNREGLTIVVVTHEERVSQAARRVVRLEDGHLVSDGDVEKNGDATSVRAPVTGAPAVGAPVSSAPPVPVPVPADGPTAGETQRP